MGDLLMPSHVSASNNEDITLLQLRPLILEHLLHLLHGNLMPANRTRNLPLRLLIPPHPIDQHPPPHDAAPLTPIMDAIRRALRRLVVRQAVVVAP